MKNIMKSWQGLILVFVAFVIVLGLSNQLFKNQRFDLTENGMYTLSDATLKILNELDKPVYLKLYFSDAGTKELPALRTYAKRVQEYLNEYASHANDKLSIKEIDPEPFSEAEDDATAAGLQGVPVGIRQDKVFFGLVGHNWKDQAASQKNKDDAQNKVDQVDAAIKDKEGEEEVIAFLQPDKEQFLEYDLTQLIYTLSHPKQPTIGIISNLNMKGGYDFRTGRPTPNWVVVQQMEAQFDLRWLSKKIDKIEKDIDVLMIVHPKKLPKQTQLAIDQFVLAGGRVLVFVDPIAESAGSNQQGINIEARRSEFAPLLKAWGVKLAEKSVIGDYDSSMVVSMGNGSTPSRHIGLLGLKSERMNQDDVIMNSLDSLTLSSAGYFEKVKSATTELESLLTSSNQSEPMDASLWENLTNPEGLLKEFIPTGKEYVLAARIKGAAKTAFPEGVVVEKEVAKSDKSKTDATDKTTEAKKPETIKETLMPTLTESKQINVVVVADTDLLTDRLWVQVQQFFGEKVINPWASNGDFLVGALENLTGNNDLISIRNQAKFTRPFTRVAALKKDAEERFYEQQNTLETRLNETEKKLADLEGARGEKDKGILSKEQEQELLSFQKEKLAIRKELRDVQHQLDKDIETLGTQLKMINIFLVPLLISFFTLAWLLFKRRKA